MDNEERSKNNDRVPGQGNSNQGVIRREGFEADKRGQHVKKEEDTNELTHIEPREREGSQGDSQGQRS
jgi:hypothetical protein